MERTLYKHIIDGLEMDQVIRDHEYSMVSRHLHETYELYYLTEGQRYYFIERQTYLVKSGDVVLIKPNLIHKTSIAGESYHNRILLQIDRAFMDGVLKACGLENMETVYGQDAEILHIPEEKQPVILELFASMEREMAQKQKGWLTAVKLQLARLLLEITRCPQITEQPMQNGTWNRIGTGHGENWIEGRTLTQEEQKKDSGASARFYDLETPESQPGSGLSGQTSGDQRILRGTGETFLHQQILFKPDFPGGDQLHGQ